MYKLIKNNRFFFVPYYIFLVFASIALILYSKKDIHLFLNGFHCSVGDYFFKYITHIGDGLIVALLIVIFLFVKYRYSIVLIFSILTSTMVIQSFKRYILPDMVRPKIYFDQFNESLYLVKDVTVLTSHSFPSGHSATAFIMFLFLALIQKNNFLKLLSILLALTVAYSRVYLSHHFLIDIYVGSIIAVLLTLAFYHWVSKWQNPKLDLSITNRNKADKITK